MADNDNDDLTPSNVTPLPMAVAQRTTVALVADSVEALDKLVQRTGFKKTDVINRAIQIYEFVDAEGREGNTILVQRPDGILQKVKIL